MKTLLTELKYLDAGGDEAPTPAPDALISEMRARIQFLEDELQRKDAILLNMTEVMKAIAPLPRRNPPRRRHKPHRRPRSSLEGREPQPTVEGTRGEEPSPLEAQESHEMHMPEVHGGPLPRDQHPPSERPWWRRMSGG